MCHLLQNQLLAMSSRPRYRRIWGGNLHSYKDEGQQFITDKPMIISLYFISNAKLRQMVVEVFVEHIIPLRYGQFPERM